MYNIISCSYYNYGYYNCDNCYNHDYCYNYGRCTLKYTLINGIMKKGG